MIGRLAFTVRYKNTVLEGSTGNLSIDDQNLPAISGSIVTPYDAEVFDDIDPRATVVPRVTVRAWLNDWSSLTLADVTEHFARSHAVTLADVSRMWQGLNLGDLTRLFGAPLHNGANYQARTLELDLHVREISEDGRTMRFDVASDEELLRDWAPSNAADLTDITQGLQGWSQNRVGSFVNVFLQAVLQRSLIPGVYDSQALTSTDLVQVDYANSAYDMFRPALEDADVKLRVQPNGRDFKLERPENSINNPAEHAWLFTGAEVADGGVRRTKTRTGEWYDSAGLLRETDTGYQFAGHPGGAHSRTYVEELTIGKPSIAMAQGIVRRAKNRGDFIDLQCPIIPGVFMRDEFVYLPDGAPGGAPYQWICKSVSYDFTSGLMNIRGERRY